MNILQPVIADAQSAQSRAAIVSSSGSITYADLIVQSAQLAAAWRRKGVQPGDRVLVAMPVGIPLFASVIALWRLGAVIVFPEPSLGALGLRHAIAAVRPKAFLSGGWFCVLRYVWPALRSALHLSLRDAGSNSAAIEPVACDHPALISFTSGSTGKPKAIIRSHGLLASQSACVARLLRSSRQEIDLVAFPMFVLANLSLGGTSVLPNWDLRSPQSACPASLARLIVESGVTRAVIPPSMCERLVRGPVVQLNEIITGGGPLYPDLLQRLSAKGGVGDISLVYGSTEAEPIAHQRMRDITNSDWNLMRTGGGLLAGRPIPEIRLDIVHDEIVVSGDHVNKGYLDPMDDATTKISRVGEIWHRTGDAGCVDASGRLWLLGRAEGRANALFPFAVEAAARYWPNVSHAALISIEGKPVLAIEGNADLRNLWQKQADRIGDLRVAVLKAMPLDRRHRSKVDYAELRRLLRAS